MTEYAIEIENLVKTYSGKINALAGVSFKIRKGDVVGYLGPNGAGKTTTMKILTNLIKPTSGRAYVNGVDVNKNPREALRYIGALIEVPGVYDYFTPHEMLMYFARVYGMSGKQAKQRISESLELMKLADWEHKRIGSFSTGMLRRLVIAKAILHNPEVLILDEPVLGLDPKGMKDVRQLIRQFKGQGVTVFISSHLLGEVAETCGSVILLDKGNVIAHDSVENIGNRIGHNVINVKFLNALSAEDIEKIRAVELIEGGEIKGDTATIRFDGKPDTSAQILSRLVSQGLMIISYSLEGIGLEDFYLATTGDEKGVG